MAGFVEKRCRCRQVVDSKVQACPACGARDFRWRARYRGPDRRGHSKTWARKSDAERWLAGQLADKSRGDWTDPALGMVPFAEWADRWLGLQVDLKPKTQAGYESILRSHLVPAFGRRPLASIQPEDVEQLVADLTAEGMAPRTVRNVYRTLSGIMRAAVRSRRIASSPCLDVALPRPRKSEIRPLTAEEVAKLAAAVGEDYAPLIHVAAYTGLRWGEIAALRVGRVRILPGVVDVIESASEVGGRVQFVAPKNGRTRSVRLPRFVAEMLSPLVAGKDPGELVFAGPDGEVLRHARFYTRVFLPAVKEAGLGERVRFHDLRHTCAALLIAQGAHPRAIMERLGHSTIAVTMDVYGHLLPSLDDELAAGLEATYQAAADARASRMRPEIAEVVALRP